MASGSHSGFTMGVPSSRYWRPHAGRSDGNPFSPSMRRMADRGELPCYRIGTRQDRRFKLSDVEAYLVQRREVGKPGEDPKEYRLD